MPAQLTDREILCHFLYIVYRSYREVRNQDKRWSHKDFSKQAKLCERLGEWEMADMYDRASSGATPNEILTPFVARTSLLLEQLPTVFRDGTWRRLYGGSKWADIAEHGLRLKRAIEAGDDEESKRLSQAICRLTHNTGSLGTRRGLRPCHPCCIKFRS
jgi:hypothetical protein